MFRRVTLVALGTLGLMLIGVTGPVPVPAGPEERHSGTVVGVAADPPTRMLIIQEFVEGGKTRQLRIWLTPHTRLIRSERLPDDQVTDLRHPFRDTPIGLSEITLGDFVLVELTMEDRKAVASSVRVTFRSGTR